MNDSKLETRNSKPEEACYHCGLPVPAGTRFSVTIGGAPRAMCCAGCQ
ncbi:MAG: heavy metal translocating P-type ATPase metal-binding domain-containing protein, partial [Rhodocyclaceae bacterium]|nr:heavy metal translocating P-type ATPase metal-binding domain-containing protein [Rhodocyclaceae bacterium]